MGVFIKNTVDFSIVPTKLELLLVHRSKGWTINHRGGGGVGIIEKKKGSGADRKKKKASALLQRKKKQVPCCWGKKKQVPCCQGKKKCPPTMINGSSLNTKNNGSFHWSSGIRDRSTKYYLFSRKEAVLAWEKRPWLSDLWSKPQVRIKDQRAGTIPGSLISRQNVP